MLFIVTFLLILGKAVNCTLLELRKFLFALSIILSLFFFSSADPIIGMPLYIYPMIFSIVISLLSNTKVEKNIILRFSFLILSLIIPLIRMVLSIDLGNYLLIKESTTDTLQIYNQLHTPNVDFIVIKHFLFMMAYVLFVVFNTDIVKDSDYIQNMLLWIISIFKILFVGIIIEWVVVNLMGGINDRNLMGSIFSLKTINQSMNWKTWGSYSVALCFTERSNFNIIAIFYMIYLKKKEIKSIEWFWLVISALSIYCTGSSSCLAILVIYLVIEIFIIVIRNRKLSQLVFISFIIIGSSIVLFSNFELFTSKLRVFLSNDESASSGYYRANSIVYGIKAIKDHFLFGVGIGTVYVHCMLVQTIANIGIVSTFLMLSIHNKVCPIEKELINIILSLFMIGISYGCYMVQNFTSPFLIVIFIIISCKEEILDEKQNTQSNPLLLVRKKSFS